MRLIRLEDIESGMVLGRSIYESDNRLLLGAGFRLFPDLQKKLSRKGIQYVYVTEEGTEDVIPEDIISEELKNQARSKLEDRAVKINNIHRFHDVALDKTRNLIDNGYLKKIDISIDLRHLVEEILKDIVAQGSPFMETLMFKSSDQYTLDHSINVAVLSILVGKRFGYKRNELVDLALGALLHDFGKIVVERFANHKDGCNVADLMCEHPSYGYLLVHNSPNSSPIASQVILQHHEYQDGSGYPLKLTGDNLPPVDSVKRDTKGKIFRFAEICAAVNTFDYLLMNPSHKKPMTPFEALKQMVGMAGSRYNKHVVQKLLEVVPLYPVGAEIVLTDVVDPLLRGFRGVVAELNRNKLNRPVIVLLFDKNGNRITPRRIDTSRLHTVKMELMI